MPIRLLNLGMTTPVRSQTVYHAVGRALRAGSPDTIILVSPSAPYVSVGYHQDVAQEVDETYCQAHGLPIIRREVGGGAVYLDENQVFTQWVFHRDHLPASVQRRFELHIRPLVETYRALGIAAYHRPVNDIQVAGRKIGGTGAARIGEAEVVVGSLMFDFNFELMSRVLKVPSEKMRDKVYQSLQMYMTTMARELGHVPDRESVMALYVRQCRAALGADIIPGELTEREQGLAAELDASFVSDEWLHRKGTRRQSGVKIHEDVRVVEGAYKAPGGLIRVTAGLREGRIDDISISGDFTMLPASAVSSLETSLRGISIDRESVTSCVCSAYSALEVDCPGVTAHDLVAAILTAVLESAV